MVCWTRANLWQKSAVKSVFIRGSVVRYVHLPAAAVDTTLLEDATRRGLSHIYNLTRRLRQELIHTIEAAQASAKTKQG